MSKRTAPTRRVLLGALLLMAASTLAEVPARAQSIGEVEIDITWTMRDRFGLDANRDGRIDLPNTPAYAAAARPWECADDCPTGRFTVTLRAELTYRGKPVPFRPLEYRWAIDPGKAGELSVTNGHSALTVDLAEGPHQVRLAVIYAVPWGTAAIGATRRVEIDDLLVVAVGDSYVSGDGNPELDRTKTDGETLWGDGVGDVAVEAEHAEAHRSTISWAARAALALEQADPATSVTFVSVAAAGATVDAGLLGPQNEQLPRPQIEAVADLIGEREVDVLLISIGGNDVGFSQLLKGLVDADPWLDPICYDTDLENVWQSVADGHWNRSSRLALGGRFGLSCRSVGRDEGVSLAGLEGLPAELARLSTAINELAPEAVYLMEYPDPTGHHEGTCPEIVEDAAPFGFHEIDRREQRLGRERVLRPLNETLAEAADRYGWTFVSGVAAGFADGHGYCAAWPDYGYPAEYQAAPALLRNRLDYPSGWYRNPGTAAELPGQETAGWYRTAAQSSALQGPNRTETTGTMHPNELGHMAMAELLLAAMEH